MVANNCHSPSTTAATTSGGRTKPEARRARALTTGPPGKARSSTAWLEAGAVLEVSIGKPAANIGRDLGYGDTFGVMTHPGSDGKSGVPVPLGVVLVTELPLGVEP